MNTSYFFTCFFYFLHDVREKYGLKQTKKLFWSKNVKLPLFWAKNGSKTGGNAKIWISDHQLMLELFPCLTYSYMTMSTWDVAKTNILRHLKWINHEILARICEKWAEKCEIGRSKSKYHPLSHDLHLGMHCIPIYNKVYLGCY